MGHGKSDHENPRRRADVCPLQRWNKHYELNDGV